MAANTKQTNNPDYQRALEALTAEFKERLDALKVAFNISENSSYQQIPEQIKAYASLMTVPSNKDISLVDSIKAAINELKSPFTMRDVANIVHSKFIKDARKSSISAMLSKWGEEEQFIKVIELGSGKRPTKYGKIGS